MPGRRMSDEGRSDCLGGRSDCAAIALTKAGAAGAEAEADEGRNDSGGGGLSGRRPERLRGRRLERSGRRWKPQQCCFFAHPSAHTGPRLLLDSTNAEAGYIHKKRVQ